MHPLLRYVLVATPLAVLVFLGASDIHRAWDGHVVSHRPVPEQGSATRTVLIVNEAREGTEATWPADAVEGLPLQVDPTGTPPLRTPEGAARTTKARWGLWFTVTPADGAARVVPTYSARSLSLAALLWMLGLAIHNMLRSGSPFAWEPRDLDLPELQDGTGQVTPTAPSRKPRSRKTAPPPKPRRGPRR